MYQSICILDEDLDQYNKIYFMNNLEGFVNGKKSYTKGYLLSYNPFKS